MNSLNKMNNEIAEQFYDLVSQIPAGQVTTYGQLAKALGINPRYAGYLLHHNPRPAEIPCHRVVNAAGRLAPSFAFGGSSEQARRLEQEGVVVVGDKVDLGEFLWPVA